MLFYKSSSHSAIYVRWCDSCSLATPMQRAELNTARQSSHKSPARDDDVGERPSRHFGRGEAEWRNLTPQMKEKPARTLRHFDESVAEWRNLLPLMVRAALRGEISRLRVSSKRFPSAPYRHAAPLEMTRGSPLLSWNQNKDIKKKPSFESFFFVYETRFYFLFRN